MEILHQSMIHRMVIRVTTLKDELLVLNLRPVNRLNVRVYDLNNMARVKHVFVLPRIKPADIAACNVTGCFYVLEQHREPIATFIFRITRVDKHYIHVRTWIRDRSSSVDCISVSAEGNLIIISTQRGHLASTAVSVFNLNGSLQHRVILSPDVYGFKHVNSAIQKSNGNLVLTYVSQQFHLVLMEIDANGKIERQYKSSMSGSSCVAELLYVIQGKESSC